MVREDDMSCQTVVRVLGISRAAVCAHVVMAQPRFRTALLELLLASPPMALGRSLHRAQGCTDLSAR